MREEKGEVKIVFEDKDVLIINKPSGLVVNDAESVKSETVQSWFVKKYSIPQGNSEFCKKGGIVHRLDKDTSGIMVLAKNELAYEWLKSQFLNRQVVKKYIALVHGKLKEPVGIISLPIERHPKDRKRFAIGSDLSRQAITEWKTLKVFEHDNEVFSLLELTPHTGRTHQLRVHLRHMGHPIVSDPIYGYLKTWKEDLTWCPRLFLHALFLEIKLPNQNKTSQFSSDTLELDGILHKLDNSFSISGSRGFTGSLD